MAERKRAGEQGPSELPPVKRLKQASLNQCPGWEGLPPVKALPPPRPRPPPQRVLFRSIEKNLPKMAALYLQQGVDPNAVSQRGLPALHEALRLEESGPMVEQLLLAGADTNASSPLLDTCCAENVFATPLLVAVWFNQRRSVELLLRAGANPGLAWTDVHAGTYPSGVAMQHTPLSLAAALPGRTDVLEALLDAGAPPDKPVVRCCYRRGAACPVGPCSSRHHAPLRCRPGAAQCGRGNRFSDALLWSACFAAWACGRPPAWGQSTRASMTTYCC